MYPGFVRYPTAANSLKVKCKTATRKMDGNNVNRDKDGDRGLPELKRLPTSDEDNN